MNLTQDWIGIPDVEAERIIFEKMQLLDASARLSYSHIGLMCRDVQQRMLWQHRTDPVTNLPCRSFTRWVRVAAPYGYSTCFAAKSDIDELAGDISVQDLGEIPQSNYGTMRQLSTAVRKDPKVLHAAKTEKPEEFIAMVRVTHPEQHVEHRKSLRFRPAESAAEKIEEALRMAEERGATNRDDALELLAITAIDEWRLEDEVEDSLRAEANHA